MKTPIEDELFKLIAGKCHNDEATEEAVQKLIPYFKQVIIDAYTKAVANQKHGGKSVTAEQYYNETFKS